jgi:hypothetical protein
MPRDRLTRRALIVSTTVILLSVSTGCLRSSFVRPAVEPIPEPSSSISPGPVARPVPAAGSGQPSAPLPTLTPLSPSTSSPAIFVPAPLPVTSPNQNPSTSAPIEPSAPAESTVPQAAASTLPAVATPPAAPTPTPLLDAALERAEAINHLEDDSLDSSATLAKPTNKIPTVVQSRSSPVVTRPSTTSAPIPIIITVDTTQKPKSPEPATKHDALETRPNGPIPPIAKKIEAPAAIPPPAAQVPAAIPLPEELNPLGVSELHLCRKVHGFGSFELLNQTALRAGQRLLLYWELTGLEYEPQKDGYLSRVSSRVEIRTADSGLLQFALELGSAEERFGRRRRDNYVNCVIELPKSLQPGSYRLKLTQTDLVASRSTSAEIPLQIAP